MRVTVEKADHYEVTSEFYLKSELSGRVYRVFDESDTVLKSGESAFAFMQVGQSYDVKLFMMAERTDKVQTSYVYRDQETPGEETFAILVNEAGDEFYAALEDLGDAKVGDKLLLDNLRLDLMQVDDVLFGEYR